MQQLNDYEVFLQTFEQSVTDDSFVKLTLSKPAVKGELKNIYARVVLLKDTPKIQLTYHYKSKDETKNYSFTETVKLISQAISDEFANADLITTEFNLSLKISKKRKTTLLKRPTEIRQKPSKQHNYQKKEWISTENNIYLRKLKLANHQGEITKSGYRKYRQINKYIEIIDSLLSNHPLPSSPTIVDMGSGKGYLTFALYDYLNNKKGMTPQMTGIELRPHLVEQSNTIAKEANFNGLHFSAQDIAKYPVTDLDLLIALHACDTLTDIAIAKGIQADASIIIVAPCCHKQIRKQVHHEGSLSPLIKYGIHKERIAEILTDSIRSLILEAHGYQTKIFEFISIEHTGKNTMITAVKKEVRPDAIQEIIALKKEFNIDFHYLEQLLPGLSESVAS